MWGIIGALELSVLVMADGNGAILSLCSGVRDES